MRLLTSRLGRSQDLCPLGLLSIRFYFAQKFTFSLLTLAPIVFTILSAILCGHILISLPKGNF